MNSYPKTRHLLGSGLPDARDGRDNPRWKDFSGRHAVFEEKVDGTHSGFFFDGGGNLSMLSHGGMLDPSSRGGAEAQFDLMKDWLAGTGDAFLERIEDRYAVFGEWCRNAHSIHYDALPHLFLEFDVLDLRTGEYLSTPRRTGLLEGLPLASVPVLWSGTADPALPPSSFVRCSVFSSDRSVQALAEAARDAGASLEESRSRFENSGLSEGVYVKIEEDGRVVERLKWVRPGFVSHAIAAGHWSLRRPVRNALAPGANLFAAAASRPPAP